MPMTDPAPHPPTATAAAPACARPGQPARRRWRRRALAGAITLAVLAGCTTLDEKQREWIFQPSDRTWAGGLAAAQGMQDVWIDFDSRVARQSARLHGLWLPQPRADAPVLLYLHGARWDVRGSAQRIRRMHELGFAVLGIDYRGFGQSSAALPSEALATEDAHAAWDWLGRQHPGQKRYLFGHSLGSAIAVNLAADLAAEQGDALAGLMLEGSFTSMPDVVRQFKWGWLPVGPLITQRFDAADRIGQVQAPVLVVHGSEDTLIAPELGRALFDRAREPKRFVLVEGGSHHNTNTLGEAQYRAAVAELFGMSGAQGATRQATLSGLAPASMQGH
jgi:hypothetical protein